MKLLGFASLALTLLPSCALFGGPAGAIKVSEVSPLVLDISTRHDVYVAADDTLTPELVTTYLGQTASVRDVLAGAGKFLGVEVLEPAMEPVMARYDAYVRTDAALSESLRRVLLRSTLILRTEVFPAARGE
jgi:hypothetical protein